MREKTVKNRREALVVILRGIGELPTADESLSRMEKELSRGLFEECEEVSDDG